MNNRIELPTVGEILEEEFMKPYGISAYRLAHDICVPVLRIQDILHNRRRMTVDTSLRLRKYFGISERYFINIQNNIDLRQIEEDKKESLSMIVPQQPGYAFATGTV